MSKFISIISLMLMGGLQLKAQQPVITNIHPVKAFPGTTVAINGRGFSANPADLSVWFGAVKAAITTASANFILVTVPAAASAENITVINLTSGLAGQSMEKFYPVYSGNNFDPALTGAPLVFSDTKQVFDPCTCDLDGDGLPDIITTKFENATDILILRNQSTPENLALTPLSVTIGQPTVNIGCGDLNGDGKPDLYMSRGGTTRSNIYVLPNTSTGPGNISFGAIISLSMDIDVKSRRVMHKDLNGDGKPEIIVTDSSSPDINIFENTSTGTISFKALPQIVTVAGASSTSGLDVQDLDGDNKPDLIIGQFFGDDVFILRNTSTATINFEATFALPLSGNSLLNLTTGDFNMDDKLDIAVVGNIGDKAFIFPNNSSVGIISFSAVQSFAVNDAPWGIAAGDVDGDGIPDLAITSINQNLMTVLNNTSSGGALSFTKKDMDVGKATRNLKINDIDGDAKPDFILTTFTGASNFDVRVLRNTNCYQPQIRNEQPLAICPGQTITLTTPASPAVAFSWTKDGTPVAGTNNTLDITTFGNYEVTATSESGACTPTASINVANGSGTIPGTPTAGNDGPVCLAGDLGLNVNTVSGAIYQWSGPDNFSSTQQNPVISNVTNDAAGIYYVTIQSGDCRSAESGTTVQVVTLPEFNASASGPTDVCQGGTVSLSAQSRVGYTYQWLRDGSPVGGATANTYMATQSGVYSVLINDSGSSCETTTNAIEANFFSQPVAGILSDATGCTGQEISFNDNSSVDAAASGVYNWNFGDGTTSTDKNPMHTYGASGNYTVQLSISYTGVAGCSDNITKTIAINDPIIPIIESDETAVCPGTALELRITGTFNAAEWTTGEATTSIMITEPGVYGVTVTDTNGCTATTEINIGAKPLPDLQVTADKISVSPGEQVQLIATGADTYVWTPGLYLTDSTIANPLSTPEESIIYTVTGSLNDGCSSTAEITINVSESGAIDITPLKAFSPNSTINPTWEIKNVENYPDCTLSIFDEKGSLVFREKGYNNTWNATYQGGFLPEGAYYYVFGCEGLKPKTGAVLVVR